MNPKTIIASILLLSLKVTTTKSQNVATNVDNGYNQKIEYRRYNSTNGDNVSRYYYNQNDIVAKPNTKTSKIPLQQNGRPNKTKSTNKANKIAGAGQTKPSSSINKIPLQKKISNTQINATNKTKPIGIGQVTQKAKPVIVVDNVSEPVIKHNLLNTINVQIENIATTPTVIMNTDGPEEVETQNNVDPKQKKSFLYYQQNDANEAGSAKILITRKGKKSTANKHNFHKHLFKLNKKVQKLLASDKHKKCNPVKCFYFS